MGPASTTSTEPRACCAWSHPAQKAVGTMLIQLQVVRSVYGDAVFNKLTVTFCVMSLHGKGMSAVCCWWSMSSLGPFGSPDMAMAGLQVTSQSPRKAQGLRHTYCTCAAPCNILTPGIPGCPGTTHTQRVATAGLCSKDSTPLWLRVAAHPQPSQAADLSTHKAQYLQHTTRPLFNCNTRPGEAAPLQCTILGCIL